MDLGPRDRAEALLLKAARAYGIPVQKDDVHHALDDTAFVDWANLHLATDHLLTADELALYTALDKSGQVDSLADAHDLGEVQAVNEDDIRAAIDELNRSTATISKQTETLRQQQEALARLVKKRDEAEAQRRDLEEARLNKTKHAIKKLAFEVDGEAQSLEYRVADLEQMAKESRSSLTQTVDSVLQSDDKLLSSLQKLGWELDQQDPEETQTIEKLREICMRLIKTTVETLRTRLDRIYLEAILAAERSGDAKPATGDEVKALEEELESLYSEILPVAQMSTEQQHLEPALKSTDSQSGQSLRRSAVAISYVTECLDHLLDKIGLLAERIETLKSHHAASSSIIATARAEVSASLSPDKRLTKPAMPASPVRNPSPIRMRSNTGSRRNNRRRSSGILDEPAIEALLRSLALSLPLSEDASIHDQASTLAQVVAERSSKADDVVRNAQDSFEASATSRLEDARLAVQLLRDSVLAESPFGEVKLVDPEIEGSIHVLGQEVDKAREKLEEVGGNKAMARSVAKDELFSLPILNNTGTPPMSQPEPSYRMFSGRPPRSNEVPAEHQTTTTFEAVDTPALIFDLSGTVLMESEELAEPDDPEEPDDGLLDLFLGMILDTQTQPTSFDSKNDKACQVSTDAVEELPVPDVPDNNGPQTTGSWRSWWWEIGAASVSITCICAVAGVFHHVNGIPLESWPLGIPAVVFLVIVAMVVQTTVVVPVSSCLDRLKWRHMSVRSRPLEDLQLFDDASRGPWGSLLLIRKLGLKSKLGLAAALVVISLLGTDLCAQQIIGTKEAMSEDSMMVIGKADNYFSKGFLQVEGESWQTWDYNSDLAKFQASVLNSLAGNPFEADDSCPSWADSCLWPDFTSLGVCNTFHDFKNFTTRQCHEYTDNPGLLNCTYNIPLARSSPEGHGNVSISMAYHNTSNHDFHDRGIRQLITRFVKGGLDGSIGQFVAARHQDDHWSSEQNEPSLPAYPEVIVADLRWCKKTYRDGQDSSSTRNDSVMLEFDGTELKADKDGLRYWFATLTTPEREENFTITRTLEAHLPRYLESILDLDIPERDVINTTQQISFSRAFNLGALLLDADMEVLTNELAKTLTNQLRSDYPGDNRDATNITGTVFKEEGEGMADAKTSGVSYEAAKAMHGKMEVTDGRIGIAVVKQESSK
ncbi:hypothetical protein FZEAL_4508 [Fusarium zealandicum]|uniref:Uncharacterized protein n=1 Tax=Fusarium zealandicum TaxID=1053134 RepID=A0A8H4XKR4_9HYPO|nr:hypothetical protein FZEAL_4508 [Fusarium zealandicum]